MTTEVTMPKEIVLIPVDELIYYARNARTHPTEQVDQIMASIKEFGFRDPIEVAADKTIIAGHGRILAAKRLGLTHVPCVVHDDMTKAQWRAYNLVNNKLTDNSDWNPDLLKIEIEELKIDFDFGSLGFDMGAAMFSDGPPVTPGPTKDYTGATELDESEFSNFEHKCPSCGFEFND